MKEEIKQVNKSSNQVAFLSGAMLNVIIGIIQNGITTSESYLLIAAAVGGIVWLLLNRIYQTVKSYW